MGAAFHAAIAGAITHDGCKNKTISAAGVATKAVEETFSTVEYEPIHKALAEGMAMAWIRYRMPYFKSNYQVVAVEREWEVQLGDEVIFMARPDIVLKDELGDYHAMEFKTTGFIRDDWLNAWRYDLQLNGHFVAVDAGYGPCESVMLEFLYKGRKYKGVYQSPLIQGYKQMDPVTAEWMYDWDYSRCRKGWIKFNVWEETFADKPSHMSNIEYWVFHVLDNATVAQQLTTRRFFRVEGEVDEWIKSTYKQESALVNILTQPEEWPAHKSKDCAYNKYYRACTYKDICFGPLSLDNYDGFTYRDPHHPAEFDL